MNGIYFAQGVEAAKSATQWSDAARLCPHGTRGLELNRRQVWMNGFTYEFASSAEAKAVLAKFTLKATA